VENENFFDELSDSCAKYCSLTEHLAVDGLIVLFNDRVVLKKYIPKKHKWFGTKIYKLTNTGQEKRN
jgi:hypothetical protein